jgi:hypothetical protein
VVLACLTAVAGPCFIAGCGGPADGLPRQAVGGNVRFKGEPLKDGSIQFQPTSPGEATAAGGLIVDGKYSIPKSEGLVPGKYQVIISGIKAEAAAARTEMPGESKPAPVAKDPIPVEYNARSTLTAEIKKDAANQFDFDLQPK